MTTIKLKRSDVPGKKPLPEDLELGELALNTADGGLFLKKNDGTVKAIGIDSPDDIVPPGVILMWSGSIASIPSGWALCNGSNGTPNLLSRFIVGAGSSYAVGDTGGANSVSLTVAQLPAHNHSASTGSAGSHSHSGSASSAGSHTHTIQRRELGHSGSWVSIAYSNPAGASGAWVDVSNQVLRNSAAGAHTHSLSINSNGAHTHTVSVGNTGSGQAHENRPPYYALAYIMKL